MGFFNDIEINKRKIQKYLQKPLKIIQGDALDVLKTLESDSVDCCVTDPPYELGFMGKKWDSTGIAYNVDLWREMLRVLKPGGHLLSFGGSRTYHRMACAIEDAGFEVRDMIEWVYGCLSEDTEILTESGYKPLHKLTQYDRIGVYDITNNIYKWERPQRYSVYKVHEDTAFRIKSDYTDQIVSRNHRCLVEREGKLVFIQAEELNEVEYMPTLSEDFYTLQENSNRKLLFKELLWKGKGLAQTIFSKWTGNKKSEERIEVRKEPGLERWSNLLEETRKLQADKICEVSEGVFTDGEKRWICNGTSFDNGSILGDMFRENPSSSSYQSRPTGQPTGKSDVISIKQGTQIIRRATVTKIEYSGIIFCPTVSTGAFVARRNGQVFITGNSGFPKSLNIGKSVNQLETNEWSKIGKALDNIDQKSIMEVWKSNSNNVKIVETQSLKNQIIVGQDTPSENFVVLNVVQNSSQENSNLLVSFVEQNLNEVQAINTKTNTALPSVEVEIRQLQDNVNFAEKQLQNQNHKSWNIFTAQCNVKEWLSENTEVNHKVDEALKTLRGNKKYSNEEITNVLCVVLTNALKLTILNQSKTFQNLGTNQKMECVSAINVIITEYTAENLISNTVAILKSKAVDKLLGNEREDLGVKTSSSYPDSDGVANYKNRKKSEGTQVATGGMPRITKGTSEWEGWGTALKPAHEPICLARKPLSEKTVAENVLKWGTGGLNIDGCRVGVEERTYSGANKIMEARPWNENQAERPQFIVSGRFPANLIHDGSDEVVGLFPQSKGQQGDVKGTEPSHTGVNCYGKYGRVQTLKRNDSGSAARFFYCAKASKEERGMGNIHPTIKPIALMQYLIKLVCPPNGIVLDPFAGSGSTLIAASLLDIKSIGIEKESNYIKIIKTRLNLGE